MFLIGTVQPVWMFQIPVSKTLRYICVIDTAAMCNEDQTETAALMVQIKICLKSTEATNMSHLTLSIVILFINFVKYNLILCDAN